MISVTCCCRYSRNTSRRHPISREYFLSMFMKEGIEPNIGARSTHQDVIRTANGYGYTLANVRPRCELALDGRGVSRIRLSGDHRPMGMLTLSQRRKSLLVDAFAQHCRLIVSDAYIPGTAVPVMERRTLVGQVDAGKARPADG